MDWACASSRYTCFRNEFKLSQNQYFFLYVCATSQVNKFVMDDKGALLLCAWGLPPMAHTDDPHRATGAVTLDGRAFF